MGKTYVLKSGAKVKQPFNKFWIALFVSLALFVLAAWMVLQDAGTLKLGEIGTILRQLFTPTRMLGIEETWGDYFAYLLQPEFKEALGETMRMSFLGSLLGSVLCLPFAILCSQNITRKKWIYLPVRFFINLIRTLPTMVIAVVTVSLIGMGELAGIIATSLFTFGIMTKMLYEYIEALDMRPYEALQSCGANKTKSFFYALFPQLLPTYLGYFIYNFEINVRTSVVLGYVGAGGLGLILTAYMDNVATRSRVGAILIFMFVIVTILQGFTRYTRGKLQ